MSKLDEDLKTMSVAELRKELKRYRQAARKIVKTQNNARCWINDWDMANLLPEKPMVPPVTLTDTEFLCNCANYLKRQRRQKRKK